ncbi:MAG: RagB/SusD family nutrient uptake outer membrane protein [Bacteroidota bacterium]|nr:RagB/SusD family nutrient uptake outer membrane protein [Bacteroidota bacterium]
MKLINKILILCCITFLVNACSLKEEPYGFLSTANFYKNANDANAAIIDCYANLGEVGLYSRMLFYATSYSSGEFDTKGDGGLDAHELVDWYTEPTNTTLDNIFKSCYLGISRANGVITNVPSIAMDTLARNQIVGEAYFLRALHYFNLVRLFGQVPMRTAVVGSSSEICTPKASLSDLYTLIESDLLKAERLMNIKYTDGRANPVAAQALLAKVYLHMASSKASGVSAYSFVTNADTYYAKAATYAAKVLDPSQTTYTFWTGDLRRLWSIANEKGNEFIFSIAMDKSGTSEGQFSKAQKNWTPYINGGLITLGPNYTASITDGWNQCITNTTFYNSFSASDKRRNAWICNSVKDNTGKVYSYPGNLAFPFPIKLADTTATSDVQGHYIPVLRYSDIALVYAEAAGPTTAGYSWINKIRGRAGLPDLTPGLGVAAFRDSVVRERSFELCFEMNRLYDLRRTNTVKSVLEGIYGKKIDSHADFYDIPQSEVDGNPCLNQ